MSRTFFLLILAVHGSFSFRAPHEYHYIKEEKTWHEAQKYCREKYTDLATVSDQKDMEALRSTKDRESGKEAWIGLYSKPGQEKKTWYWSLPGVEFDNETSWANNEPNDINNNEFCVMLDHEDGWRDNNCDDPKWFLCYDDSSRGSGAASAAASCSRSSGENPGHQGNNTNNKRVKVIKQMKSWPEAQKYCRKHHTDLVSGQSQLMYFRCPQSQHQYWIGLFTDAWKWSDGSNSTFRNFSGFENGTSQNECATVTGQLGDWNSENCSQTKPFICYDDKVILIKESLNWTDAWEYCNKHHSYLVAITNLHQQRWVQARAKNANTSYVWLGLLYSCPLDLWFWVNDELPCYENWIEKYEGEDRCTFAAAMEKDEQHKICGELHSRSTHESLEML